MPDKPTNQAQSGLTAVRRTLQKETARRQIAEAALRKSKERDDHLVKQSRLLREQLQQLARQTLLDQEEERKRISRELHDVIAQMLAGINIHLAALKIEAAENSTGLRRKISSTQKLVEKSVDVIRRFACELRPVVLDDLGLIPALHSCMKSFTEETGVRVSLTAFAGVEKLSMSKRLGLYRIVQEGLTNVARHAHASRVDVSIKKLPAAIHMQIKDNGNAFDATRMLHSRKNKPLGLIGMRERTEMIGGKFIIESTPGNGTILHVRIPSKPTPGVPLAMTSKPERITVLLADDHQIVREGLRKILESETDIDVVGEAASGRQAVATAKKLHPAVIVMDIAMPRLNGIEATRQILEALPETKVLILSAYGDDAYIEKTMETGASGFLIKQTSSGVLSDAIRELKQGNTFFSPSVAKRLRGQNIRLGWIEKAVSNRLMRT